MLRLSNRLRSFSRLAFSGLAAVALCCASIAGEDRPRDARATKIEIVDGRWRLNGELTCRGTKAEGLLMNARMVNATFEDRNRTDFDADANTGEFVAQIPDYVAHGVRAFTLNLQGGMPGYEGAANSAFEPDGALRAPHLARVRRVIEACDRHGAAVILGCFYQRQDQLLRDENAVRAAVVNTAKWIRQNGFANVLLEIANEYPHRGFDHGVIKTHEGMAELLRLAKRTAPDLLVSASELGGRAFPPGFFEHVAPACDYLLIHLNLTPLADVPARLASLPKTGQPIVCNEDEKVGEPGASVAELCVAHGVSWGLMHQRVNQWFPFSFAGAADDPVVYAKLKELTSTPRASGSTSTAGGARALSGVEPYLPRSEPRGGGRIPGKSDNLHHVSEMDPARPAQLGR